MNIAHYSLGFPPLRTGGMTKYCMDLLVEQYKQGNNVFLLWPGKLKNSSTDMNLKIHSDYYYENAIIHSIEIVNPLPIPLLNGINQIEYFIQQKNIEKIKDFFKKYDIEALHIHTLMGLPIEIIDVCKKANIKTVFTTHDYFGICPKWGLQKIGKICDNDNNCKDCIECNVNALSFRKMKFLQSNMYKRLKNSNLLKFIRSRNNRKLYIEDVTRKNNSRNTKIEGKDYIILRNYYKEILGKIDILHFNSYNTKKVYSKYIKLNNKEVVLSISNSLINNHKRIRTCNNGFVKFGYLGPITKHKGYFFLKEICDELKEEENKFELHIFAETTDSEEYLIKHNAYEYGELEKIMNYFDVLVVPSQWYETFGFTVLEALSYGIPVIVTENVGAKDLIIDGLNGLITKDNKEEFKKAMRKLIKESKKINEMNKYIVENTEIKNMKMHSQEITKLYK